MAAELDGPRLAPRSGRARQLVVFLHGYGADGNDLIEIGKVWQPLLPDAAFVSPHAPEPCGQAPVGRQWFALTFRDPNERWIGVNQARPILERSIDAELRRLGLPASALALVGFSQGTMMALHVGLSRSAACIVGFSGMLAGEPPKLGQDAPPILLVHGDADQMIPPGAIFDAATRLGRAGANVQWHISQGIGHSIDEAGLALAGLHLTMAFRGMLKRNSAEISCSVG
jgi:phospholipase/carboxylesterase